MSVGLRTEIKAERFPRMQIRKIDDDELEPFLFVISRVFSENHELPVLPRSTRAFQERDYLADSAAESPMIDRDLCVARLLLLTTSKTE